MPVAIEARAKTVSPDRSQGTTLKFVPILGPSFQQPPYELLKQETLPHIIVTEVNQAGVVPELRVENRLDVRVFLIDGQELIGAKQNRILNADVLVPAHATLTIPVSCVEQGRWEHNSPAFSVGKSASHRIRSRKLSAVRESLREQGGHDANQGEVWAVLPFRPDFTATLIDYLAGKMPAAPAFAVPARERGAKMFKADLEAARKAWLEASQTHQEREKREQTTYPSPTWTTQAATPICTPCGTRSSATLPPAACIRRPPKAWHGTRRLR